MAPRLRARLARWRVLGVVGTALCAVGLGGAVGLVVAGERASAGPSAPPVFGNIQLMPGERATGGFTVSPQSTAFAPSLRIDDLRESCQEATCASAGDLLSGVLEVQVTAPDGSTLHTTLAELANGQILPGGLIRPGDSARHYRAVLSMPAHLEDSYQDRSLSFDVQYGPAIAVLAHHGHRNPEQSDQQQLHQQQIGNQAGALPFTGADIVLEVAAALSALAAGVILVGAARRRRA